MKLIYIAIKGLNLDINWEKSY